MADDAAITVCMSNDCNNFYDTKIEVNKIILLTTFIKFCNVTFHDNNFFNATHQLGAKGDVTIGRGAGGTLILPEKTRVGSKPVGDYVSDVIQKREPFRNDHTSQKLMLLKLQQS